MLGRCTSAATMPLFSNSFSIRSRRPCKSPRNSACRCVLILPQLEARTWRSGSPGPPSDQVRAQAIIFCGQQWETSDVAANLLASSFQWSKLYVHPCHRLRCRARGSSRGLYLLLVVLCRYSTGHSVAVAPLFTLFTLLARLAQTIPTHGPVGQDRRFALSGAV